MNYHAEIETKVESDGVPVLGGHHREQTLHETDY
jgi:hypothetical protein